MAASLACFWAAPVFASEQVPFSSGSALQPLPANVQPYVRGNVNATGTPSSSSEGTRGGQAVSSHPGEGQAGGQNSTSVFPVSGPAYWYLAVFLFAIVVFSVLIWAVVR